MNNIDQVAVFVDIENVINFCIDLKLPIDLSDAVEKLKEQGRITIRRSFGDIKKALQAREQLGEIDKVRRMLRDNLFTHEDIAYLHQYKNSADMRLAVEALDTAFTLPSISKFAIISGDSDYVPLFLKLREQGRSVIGVTGNKDSTAVIYRNSCDSLLYFEDLAGMSFTDSPLMPEGTDANVETDPSESDGHEQAIRDEYAGLLVKAIGVVQQAGKSTTPTSIHPQMTQLANDFNLERAGFRSINDLIQYAEAQNLVKTEQKDKDLFVFLPNTELAANQTVSTAQYRMYLQEKLKCPLPSAELRAAISEKAYDQITFNLDDGGIMMSHLAQDVTDELLGDNINVAQPEVFKYLYSLYRGRCFRFEPTSYGEYNPKINGFNAQKEEWDDHFIKEMMIAIHRDSGLALHPGKLSNLFFGNHGKTMFIKQTLNALGLKYESS